MISDLTSRTIQASLRGLDARRKAAEDNIANVQTPGFIASSVSFEDSLRNAIERGRPTSTDVSVERSTAPTQLNGNNVNVGDEMVGLTETALRQQLMVQALNGRYSTLRSAIGA